MQRSRLTLAFKPLIPLFIFCLCTLSTVSCSCLFFFTSCFLFHLNPSGFFNRMLEVFEPGALTKLLHFILSHPVDLICIQETNINSSSSFRIPGFSARRSDCTHFRSGIFSPDTTHASGGVIIHVRQSIFFSELATSSLSLLDPYSDYLGVNISLNNSFLLSFLNVYAPPIRSSPTDSRTDCFSPSFFPLLKISSFWGASPAITPSGTQKVLPTPVGRKYLIGSSFLTFPL